MDDLVGDDTQIAFLSFKFAPSLACTPEFASSFDIRLDLRSFSFCGMVKRNASMKSFKKCEDGKLFHFLCLM